MKINQDESIDITNIKENNCTPILAKNILECISFSTNKVAFMDNIEFKLDDLGVDYRDNAPVCVNNISYSYDSIGFGNSSIKSRYSCEEFNMIGQNPIMIRNGALLNNLYERYLGSTSINCCINSENPNEQKFIEKNLEILIDNLNVTIEGTIGNQPFIGHFNYTGSLA